MTPTAADSPQSLLASCAAAAPQTWFPSEYARAAGIPRDALDAPLNQLRLAGLIKIADWVTGRGQGYALTPAGEKAAKDPRRLNRLLDGPPPAEEDKVTSARLTAWERGEAVRQIFNSTDPGWVTRVLMASLVIVFVLCLWTAHRVGIPLEISLDSGASPVQMWLFVRAKELTDGQWWRVLTYAWVHGGWIHLAVNLIALFNAGRIAERMWGRWRMLALYLLGAIGGGVGAVLVNPLVPTVGASGALCGLIAGEMVWLALNRVHLDRRLVLAWRRNLFSNVILIALISAVPGVSWAGHLGGAVVGALAAALLNFQRFGSPSIRRVALLGLLLLPAACVWVLYHNLPK